MKKEVEGLTAKARADIQPHLDALVETIKKGAVETLSASPASTIGGHQFAYGGIAIQLFVDTLLRRCPEMSEGKTRDLFDENYATAVKFGTMLFFAQRDVSQ
jgi:hypothetical protein